MKTEHFWGLLAIGILGLAIINAITKQKWCGPNCRIILRDAQGTLVQDVVTGFFRWI